MQTVAASKRDAGHCTGNIPLSGRVKQSKVEGEEEGRKQPSSVPCWITPVHAYLWSCSLSRQLLTGGSAAAQLFLTAPGKNSLREKVHALGKSRKVAFIEVTGVLVLPQVSYPPVYQQRGGGSSRHLISDEGHLSRAALSLMAPGARRAYVWQQSVPAQDSQKGV